MRVDLFDFDLPEERIALRPAVPREAAKLLEVRPAATPRFRDRVVGDLPALLNPGDVLVINDTRVIPARLHGVRTGRGDTTPKIEVTLHQRADGAAWKAFARPARKLHVGDTLRFGAGDAAMTATIAGKGEGGEIELSFDGPPSEFHARLAAVGIMPLPPYIAGKRPVDERDADDYQTVFASAPGAVAAPTAGLHLTEQLLSALRARGVCVETLTLHVGAGTFLPVKSETVEGHRMHAERGIVAESAAARINDARRSGGRVVACGTTVLRLLESACRSDGTVEPFAGDTDIFISPGYRFRAVDLLLTNFHLPRSTLFMLVSAFSGLGCMKAAYAYAIAAGYRFYSYGDATLLEPGRG